MDHQALSSLRDNVGCLRTSDQDFVGSLLTQLDRKGHLSDKQWRWLEKMAVTAAHLREGVPDFTAPPVVDVGDFAGVIALFDKAKAHLKHPKIRLHLADEGQDVALSVAGWKSSRPGCVNVTNGRPYGESVWFGRVTPQGKWEASRAVPEGMMTSLVAILAQLAGDPAGTAADYGRLTGHCCFCGSELSDERSTEVGYGPTCAKHFGLPWGKPCQRVIE